MRRLGREEILDVQCIWKSLRVTTLVIPCEEEVGSGTLSTGHLCGFLARRRPRLSDPGMS